MPTSCTATPRPERLAHATRMEDQAQWEFPAFSVRRNERSKAVTLEVLATGVHLCIGIAGGHSYEARQGGQVMPAESIAVDMEIG
jgi:hypothetical protein